MGNLTLLLSTFPAGLLVGCRFGPAGGVRTGS